MTHFCLVQDQRTPNYSNEKPEEDHTSQIQSESWNFLDHPIYLGKIPIKSDIGFPTVHSTDLILRKKGCKKPIKLKKVRLQVKVKLECNSVISNEGVDDIVIRLWTENQIEDNLVTCWSETIGIQTTFDDKNPTYLMQTLTFKMGNIPKLFMKVEKNTRHNIDWFTLSSSLHLDAFYPESEMNQ